MPTCVSKRTRSETHGNGLKKTSCCTPYRCTTRTASCPVWHAISIQSFVWNSNLSPLHRELEFHPIFVFAGILTPLYSGCTIRMLPKFDPQRVSFRSPSESDINYSMLSIAPRNFTRSRLMRKALFQIWDFITANGVDPVSIFMGVPTMYVKLISHYEQNLQGKVDPKQFQEAIRKHIRSA